MLQFFVRTSNGQNVYYIKKPISSSKNKIYFIIFFSKHQCYETHLKLIKEEIEKQEKVES